MNTILLSLGFLLVLYIGGLTYLKRNPDVQPNWLTITGGIFLLIKTRKGIPTIQKITESTDKWDSWGNAGVIFSLIVMAFSFIFIIFSSISVLTQEQVESTISPKNYLVIPGVNDFIPLSVLGEVLLALFIAMVIHELGHAIYCIYEGIGIQSTGLIFLGIIPLGAFVEPDEEGQEKAKISSRLRMFSAGVFNNLWLTLGSLVLLMTLTSLLITPISGAYIAGSDVDNIENGDVITSINGEQVTSNEEFNAALDTVKTKEIDVTFADGQQEQVTSKILISSVLESSNIPSGAEITAVNSEQVSTVQEAKNKIYESDSNMISLTTTSDSYTYSTGAGYITTGEIQVQDQMIPQSSIVTITSVDNTIIHSSEQIDSLSEHDTATIIYDDTTYTITDLESLNQNANSITGINGLEIDPMNVNLFQGNFFYSLVTGDLIEDSGWFLWIIVLLFGPFASLLGFNTNFPGFAGEIENFYTVTVTELGMIEPLILFGLTTLYWSFWLNFNLFVFNCIPTYALDGGHILRDTVQIIGDKFNISNDTIITIKQSVLMITILALLSVIGKSI